MMRRQQIGSVAFFDGAALRAARLAGHFTLVQAAALIGVSPALWSSWEREKAMPDGEQAKAIQKHFAGRVFWAVKQERP